MKSTNRIDLKVRLPSDLKDWLENRSIRNFRKMNAEITAILSALRDAEKNTTNQKEL